MIKNQILRYVVYKPYLLLLLLLFFQCGVVDVFPDDLGIDKSAASGLAFVMLASCVSIYVHSMLVVTVAMCSRKSSQSACYVCHLFGT